MSEGQQGLLSQKDASNVFSDFGRIAAAYPSKIYEHLAWLYSSEEVQKLLFAKLFAKAIRLIRLEALESALQRSAVMNKLRTKL